MTSSEDVFRKRMQWQKVNWRKVRNKVQETKDTSTQT